MKRIMLMNIKQTTISIIQSSQLTDFLACCSRRSDSSLSFSKFWSAILRECDRVCGAERANSVSLAAARSGSFLQERKGSTAGRYCPSLTTPIPPGIKLQDFTHQHLNLVGCKTEGSQLNMPYLVVLFDHVLGSQSVVFEAASQAEHLLSKLLLHVLVVLQHSIQLHCRLLLVWCEPSARAQGKKGFYTSLGVNLTSFPQVLHLYKKTQSIESAEAIIFWFL